MEKENLEVQNIKKRAPWGLIILGFIFFLSGFSAIAGIRVGDSFFEAETIMRILIGGFYIVVSVGIAKLKKWAYWGFMVSSLISVIFSLFQLYIYSLIFFSCSNVRSIPVGQNTLSFNNVEFFLCPDVKTDLTLWTILLLITLLAIFYVYKKRNLFFSEEKK